MFLLKVWKKEFTPCDGELSALRRGEEWDPVKYQQEKEEKEWRDKLEEERSRALNKVSWFGQGVQYTINNYFLLIESRHI